MNAVIAERNATVAAHPGLLPEDADALDAEFHRRAVDAVTVAAGDVQRVLDSYDEQVRGHTTALTDLPRPAPAAPPPAPTAPPPGPLETAGALLAGAGNALASLGNAIVQNPLEVLALAGGVSLAGVSAVGLLGGTAATATGAGAPVGVPLGALSVAGVATGGAIAATAGAAILADALGPDRVAPLSNPFGDTFPDPAAVAPTMTDARGNEWDRNSRWEALPGTIPKGEDIAHGGSSRTHIPYGQNYPDATTGGGHMWDSGIPNKTVFPESWPIPKILDDALDVARNPDQAPELRERVENGRITERWYTYGTRDGVEIEVVLERNGNIVTARPVRGPGVGRNDENGDSHVIEDN